MHKVRFRKQIRQTSSKELLVQKLWDFTISYKPSKVNLGQSLKNTKALFLYWNGISKIKELRFCLHISFQNWTLCPEPPFPSSMVKSHLNVNFKKLKKNNYHPPPQAWLCLKDWQLAACMSSCQSPPQWHSW